ncbi:MAG: hypothetical protein VR68_11555 [Peptococcaceae bacterium BRH_c4a]|nr:MAG: hypothetical protein VR68_11555 [Peptococcaceae bacterium BRH_c4a]
MKAVNVEGARVVFADEKQEKEKQRQAKLTALDNKKKQGKLTIEDLNEKLDIIIELLTEKPSK